MITEYAIAIDLGQSTNHAALAIIGYDPGEIDQRLRTVGNEHFKVVWLEHYPLGTPYQVLVTSAKRHLHHPELESRTSLILDRGEVGKAVIEMFVEAGMDPRGIQITSGNAITRNPTGWNVPKKDIVFAAVAAFASGRITIYQAPQGTPAHDAAEKLKTELSKFTTKPTKAGGQTYEAQAAADQDDLVLAVSIGVWYLREFGNRYEGVLEQESKEWDTLNHGLLSH